MVDYVDLEMWAPFDAALNPATDDYVWAASGTDGVASLTAELLPGESITIPIVLTVAEGADLSVLANTSEISQATATDGVDVVLNPDGSEVTDFDSTADAVDDDELVDNVIDNASGDEDDHDIAFVEAPLFSLGNQVWEDANNDGVMDEGERPLVGVELHLFTDADVDGIADDLDGNGVLDVSDAVDRVVTGADGDYLFSELPVGEYVVGIAPNNFEAGGVLVNSVSSAVATADANTDVDQDDNGESCDCPDGYVLSGSVALLGGEPEGEPGLVNDLVTPDTNTNLTVDFGFWFPELELDLQLTPVTTSPMTVGETMVLRLDVVNLGDVAATGELSLKLLDNGTFDEDTIPVTAAGDALFSIDEMLAPGEVFTEEFAITPSQEGAMELEAVLYDIVLMDAEGEALHIPNGDALDVDADQQVETIVLGAVLVAPSAPSSVPTGPLAFTGTTVQGVVALALMLVAIGSTILWQRRRYELPAS